MKKWIIAFCCLIFTSCAALDGYERSYGVTYFDDDGRPVAEATVSLKPVRTIPLNDK